jgi:hypothetical protein
MRNARRQRLAVLSQAASTDESLYGVVPMAGGAPDELDPPVEDGGGYRLRERDLVFLTISTEQIVAWRRREYPLGTSTITYSAFKEQLRAALHRDGLSVDDCDVRLKGSAAEFFSGSHKPMPRTREEVVDWYYRLRDRTPEPWELKEITDRLDRRWLSDGTGPTRRPFDSMYRLGIDQYPSDLDVQLSSDELVARCVGILEREGQGLEALTVENPKYKFVQRYLVEKAAQNIYLFALRMTDRLGRHVGISVFPSCGPSQIVDDPLSSHLSDSD